MLQNALPHVKRPDGDNLEKFINDSLNGIIWSDDSYITCLLRTKTVTSEKKGKTIIYAQELPLEPVDYSQLGEIIKTKLNLEEEESYEINE